MQPGANYRQPDAERHHSTTALLARALREDESVKHALFALYGADAALRAFSFSSAFLATRIAGVPVLCAAARSSLRGLVVGPLVRG